MDTLERVAKIIQLTTTFLGILATIGAIYIAFRLAPLQENISVLSTRIEAVETTHTRDYDTLEKQLEKVDGKIDRIIDRLY